MYDEMTKQYYTEWGQVPLLLGTDEVATILRVHVNTVVKLIHDGNLPARKVGRAFKVSKSDLREYIASTNE